jgi:flagella basal body P-ring formation protein FlgA
VENEFGQVSQNNVTIKVSCGQPKQWSLRVPVKIQHLKPVAVSTTLLSKGHVVAANDVNVSKQDVSLISDGYYQDPEQIIGLVVQRTIPAGNIIRQNMVKERVVIRRGELVRMVIQASGFSVEGSGVALTDGIKGQMIRVKNTRSNKIVEAVVQDTGVAVIPI